MGNKSVFHYIPKSSMCAGCTKRDEDCSNLPFHTMAPLEQEANVIVVKCRGYRKAGTDNTPKGEDALGKV